MLKLIKFLALYFYAGAGYRTEIYLRLICFFKQRRMNRFAGFFANRLQRIQGVFISPSACFDSSLTLKHPVGIVIGEGVKLGSNVTIYQHVTLGGARLGDSKMKNYPEIGDNTVIFAGAAVIGKVYVGSNCIIGANSVVMSDVPDGCTAVGAPAKILKKN